MPSKNETGPMGTVYALFAGITWGFSGTLASFLPHLSPLVIGALRLQVGGVVLMAIFMISRQSRPTFSREGWGALTLSGAAMAFVQLVFFSAVRLAGVGLATMIYIGLTPLFGGILERTFDGIRPTRSWKISLVPVLAGTVLLSFEGYLTGGTGAESSVSLPGILLAVAASFGWSLTGLSMKRAQTYRGAMETTSLSMVIGGIILIPLLFIFDLGPLDGTAPLVTALLLGIVATSIPYFLFNRAVRLIPAGQVFVLAMTEPLTAALLSVLILGESLSLLRLGGYCLIFAGVLYLSLSGTATDGANSP